MTNDFFSKLKSDTLILHKNLEKASISQDIMSCNVNLNIYANYLKKILAMHKEVEENAFPIVNSVIKDIDQRKKTETIKADIKALGKDFITTDLYLDENYSTQLNFNLGLVYVTEGSVLGGQYILKNIKNVLGLNAPGSFFNVYGEQTGSMWKKFLTQLNEYQITLSDTERDEIITGAKYGFERAGMIFTEVYFGVNEN